MGDSGSSTQTSNRVTDVASNITEASEQVSEETQRTSGDTVGQGTQQPPAVSEETSANVNENAKEASREENANELNTADPGHTVSDTADVTSNNAFAAKNDEEIKHVVAEQREATTGSEKNPSTSQEDQNNRSECGGTGSTDVDNAEQVPNEDSMPSADSSLPEHVQSVNKSTKGKGLKRRPVLNEGNDVSTQPDDIVDLEKTDRTENVSLEEHEQKLVQQEEKEECHKADLKLENRKTNKDSDIPDTGGEGSNVDTRTSGNKLQTAEENNEDESATKLNVQGNLNKGRKIKEDESVAQRIARSTTAASQANDKVCFSSLNC